MRVAPSDLPVGLVEDALRRHWSIEATTLAYAPLGFGSHHWQVTATGGRRWFATADAVGAGGADEVVLTAALRTSGLEFVVAPVPDRQGDLLVSVGRRYALAVYPFVPGDSGYGDDGAWHDEDERFGIARLLGRLHATPVPDGAPPFSYELPQREALEAALHGDDKAWTAGPYGERVRHLVRERRAGILALLARYAELVAAERADPQPWVVTHGEPHSGNVVRRGAAAMHVVDWDTVRVAPRERDLRDVLHGPGDPAWAAYRETAGDVDWRPEVAELFHAWWDLSEIGEYVRWFRGPHADSADDRTAWAGLRWSPDIAKRCPGLH